MARSAAARCAAYRARLDRLTGMRRPLFPAAHARNIAQTRAQIADVCAQADAEDRRFASMLAPESATVPLPALPPAGSSSAGSSIGVAVVGAVALVGIAFLAS